MTTSVAWSANDCGLNTLKSDLVTCILLFGQSVVQNGFEKQNWIEHEGLQSEQGFRTRICLPLVSTSSCVSSTVRGCYDSHKQLRAQTFDRLLNWRRGTHQFNHEIRGVFGNRTMRVKNISELGISNVWIGFLTDACWHLKHLYRDWYASVNPYISTILAEKQ